MPLPAFHPARLTPIVWPRPRGGPEPHRLSREVRRASGAPTCFSCTCDSGILRGSSAACLCVTELPTQNGRAVSAGQDTIAGQRSGASCRGPEGSSHTHWPAEACRSLAYAVMRPPFGPRPTRGSAAELHTSQAPYGQSTRRRHQRGSAPERARRVQKVAEVKNGARVATSLCSLFRTQATVPSGRTPTNTEERGHSPPIVVAKPHSSRPTKARPKSAHRAAPL